MKTEEFKKLKKNLLGDEQEEMTEHEKKWHIVSVLLKYEKILAKECYCHYTSITPETKEIINLVLSGIAQEILVAIKEN